MSPHRLPSSSHHPPIRVLLTLSSGRFGGAEVHVSWLAEALQADPRFEVGVACRPGPIADHMVKAGIRVHRLGFGDGPDLLTPWRLAGLARDFDLFHAHMNRAALYTRAASWLSGRPWMATAHGMTKGVYYRGASRVIAVSDAVRAHLAGQGVGGLVVVHNGVPLAPAPAPEQVLELRARAGVEVGGLLAMTVANHHPNKGLEVAIGAVAAADPRWRLALVGQDLRSGPLRELADRLGAGDRVVGLPAWSPAGPAVEAADVVLVPSAREAFSLVAAEARMRGVPVLASDVDGLAEVVPDGEGGCRRLGVRTPEAWARALDQLAGRMEQERRRASQRAPRARERFGRARWLRETLPLYPAVLRDGREKPRSFSSRPAPS